MPTRKFCFICGKTTAELYEGMCRFCVKKEKELFTLINELEAAICRECGDFQPENILKIAEREVSRNLKHRLEEIDTKVRVLVTEGRGKNLLADLEVVVEGASSGLAYRAALNPSLKIKEVLCPIL
jgi:NMD protein affecting ribosome stability and mRNA decay